MLFNTFVVKLNKTLHFKTLVAGRKKYFTSFQFYASSRFRRQLRNNSCAIETKKRYRENKAAETRAAGVKLLQRIKKSFLLSSKTQRKPKAVFERFSIRFKKCNKVSEKDTAYVKNKANF